MFSNFWRRSGGSNQPRCLEMVTNWHLGLLSTPKVLQLTSGLSGGTAWCSLSGESQLDGWSVGNRATRAVSPWSCYIFHQPVVLVFNQMTLFPKTQVVFCQGSTPTVLAGQSTTTTGLTWCHWTNWEVVWTRFAFSRCGSFFHPGWWWKLTIFWVLKDHRFHDS